MALSFKSINFENAKYYMLLWQKMRKYPFLSANVNQLCIDMLYKKGEKKSRNPVALHYVKNNEWFEEVLVAGVSKKEWTAYSDDLKLSKYSKAINFKILIIVTSRKKGILEKELYSLFAFKF